MKSKRNEMKITHSLTLINKHNDIRPNSNPTLKVA